MKILLARPEGDPLSDLLRAVAARLRALGHNTITINAAAHSRSEMYGGMDWLLATTSVMCKPVVEDYHPHVAHVLGVVEGMTLQPIVDAVIGNGPKEIAATEGLPVAPTLLPSEPSGAFDGLPYEGADIKKRSPLADSELPKEVAQVFRQPSKRR